MTPIGGWPEKWADYTHEMDGHGIDAKPEDRAGETILSKEMHSLLRAERSRKGL